MSLRFVASLHGVVHLCSGFRVLTTTLTPSPKEMMLLQEGPGVLVFDATQDGHRDLASLRSCLLLLCCCTFNCPRHLIGDVFAKHLCSSVNMDFVVFRLENKNKLRRLHHYTLSFSV